MALNNRSANRNNARLTALVALHQGASATLASVQQSINTSAAALIAYVGVGFFTSKILKEGVGEHLEWVIAFAPAIAYILMFLMLTLTIKSVVCSSKAKVYAAEIMTIGGFPPQGFNGRWRMSLKGIVTAIPYVLGVSLTIMNTMYVLSFLETPTTMSLYTEAKAGYIFLWVLLVPCISYLGYRATKEIDALNDFVCP